MVKVTVITAGGKVSGIFEDTATPKEILEHYDIDYGPAKNSVDGITLGIKEMNSSLRDLGITKDCKISSIVKIDNAAKIVIVGAAAVVTSDVSVEDWKRIRKLSPDALVLYDDETEEPVFKVGISEGPGSASEYGIEFSETPNQDGKATVTVLLDPTAEDKTELVRNELGQSLLKLIELEKNVPEVLENIAKMEAEINASIVVM